MFVLRFSLNFLSYKFASLIFFAAKLMNLPCNFVSDISSFHAINFHPSSLLSLLKVPYVSPPNPFFIINENMRRKSSNRLINQLEYFFSIFVCAAT